MKKGDYVGLFVQMWAEAVLRQLDRVRKAREKDEADLKSHGRGEDWAPSQDQYQRNFSSRWAEEHMLIWSAYQLERWTRRLALDRGEQPPKPDEVLTALRNALEHLDEADFDEDMAIPGLLGDNRSLRTLPGGGLVISLIIANDDHGLFANDAVRLDEIEKRALAAIKHVRRRPVRRRAGSGRSIPD